MPLTSKITPRIYRSPSIVLTERQMLAKDPKPSRKQIVAWEALPDSKWIAEFDLPKQGGKRRRKRRTGKDLDRVTEQIMADVALANGGITLDGSTVGAFAVSWFEREVRKSPRKQSSHSWIIDRIVNSELGPKKLATLDLDDLDDWLDAQSQRTKNGEKGHLSDSAIRRLRGTTVTILKHAMGSKKLPEMSFVLWVAPTAKIRSGGEIIDDAASAGGVRRKFNILTDKQVKDLLAVVESISPRDLALVFVAARTGMRPAELAGLKWGDIDSSERKISIERQMVRRSTSNGPGTEFVFVLPKSDASARTIVVPAVVIEMLRKRRQDQRKERVCWRDQDRQWKDLVFTKPNGDPIDRWYSGRILERSRKHADIVDKLVPYDLRHTFATRAIYGDSPVPVMHVAKHLGHSAETCQRHYVHPGDVEPKAIDPHATVEDRRRDAVHDMVEENIQMALLMRQHEIRLGQLLGEESAADWVLRTHADMAGQTDPLVRGEADRFLKEATVFVEKVQLGPWSSALAS